VLGANSAPQLVQFDFLLERLRVSGPCCHALTPSEGGVHNAASKGREWSGVDAIWSSQRE
jgi:hypothetical protein